MPSRSQHPVARRPRLLVEELEPRTLLAANGLFASAVRFTDTAGDGDRFLVKLDGPGRVRVQDADSDGRAEITLRGTASSSELLVRLQSVGREGNGFLPVESLVVETGRLQAVHAFGTVNLRGRMTRLLGDVETLRFHALGQGTQLRVQGNLQSLAVMGQIMMQPGDVIKVGGDLDRFTVDGDMQVGAGFVDVGRDLKSLHVGGSLSLLDRPPEPVIVASQAGTRSVGLAVAGQLHVGRDLESLLVEGSLVIGDGSLAVDRDLGNLQVSGDLRSTGQGSIVVGRSLATLRVEGNWTGSNGGFGLVGPPKVPEAPGPDLVVGMETSPVPIVSITSAVTTEVSGFGSVGTIQVDGRTNRVGAYLAGRLDTLTLGGGMSGSFLTADAIGTLTANGDIIVSEIRAGRSIGAAEINGSLESSRILARPLTTESSPESSPGVREGPVLSSQVIRLVSELRTVEIDTPHGVIAITVLVFIPVFTSEMGLPGGQIGTSTTPFVLNGDLIDSVLAADWSPGENDAFEAPPPPRPLAQTTPTGDDGQLDGTIFFVLSPGSHTFSSINMADNAGIYASTVNITPANAMVTEFITSG